MAKIVITIEDLPNGKVRLHSKPNCNQFLAAYASGEGISAAEGYAVCMLNAVLKESDTHKEKPTKIIRPSRY